MVMTTARNPQRNAFAVFAADHCFGLHESNISGMDNGTAILPIAVWKEEPIDEGIVVVFATKSPNAYKMGIGLILSIQDHRFASQITTAGTASRYMQ